MGRELKIKEIIEAREAVQKANNYLDEGFERQYFENMHIAILLAGKALEDVESGKDVQMIVRCAIVKIEFMMGAMRVSKQILKEMIMEYGRDEVRDPKELLYGEYIDECKKLICECTKICDEKRSVRAWVKTRVAQLENDLKKEMEEIERM